MAVELPIVMLYRHTSRPDVRGWPRAAAAGGACLLALVLCPQARGQETVGRIEGQTFTASGQVRVVRDGGRNTTTLLSGSEVVVHEGAARLVLTDGSEMDVCGPAKLSVLKSGGALTVALEYGRLHGRLAPKLDISVYTALATATPVAVGTNQRDLVVGLEQSGNLCVNTMLGAVRLEHQFTGEKLLAPQNSEMSLDATSLNSLHLAPGACRCDPPPERVIVGVAEQRQPAPAPSPPPATPVAQTPAPRPEPVEEARPKGEEPHVVAVMPPLVFDATAPTPPVSTRPEVAQILREVRVQPAAVYVGRVELPGAKPGTNVEATRDRQARADAAVEEKKPGFGARLKNFFARLFGRKPKD